MLLRTAYCTSGMKRSCTSHNGKFFMCGTRQSDLASRIMATVSPTSNHHYFDEKKINASLLPFAHAITNDLVNYAVNVQDNCGMILMGMVWSIMLNKEGRAIKSREIAPHIIIIDSLFEKKLKTNAPFSGLIHRDKDEINPDF